jgi:hypothetical protein
LCLIFWSCKTTLIQHLVLFRSLIEVIS